MQQRDNASISLDYPRIGGEDRHVRVSQQPAVKAQLEADQRRKLELLAEWVMIKLPTKAARLDFIYNVRRKASQAFAQALVHQCRAYARARGEHETAKR